MVRIRITSNMAGVTDKVRKSNEKMLFLLTEQVLKDSNYYIPKDTGALETSGHTATLSNVKNEVSWNAPYARRLYWNPQFNFSKDVNPNARGLWFEYAKQHNKKEWERIAKGAWK